MALVFLGGILLIIVAVAWFVSRYGNLEPAMLRKLLVVLAVVLALPFISCGSLFWMNAPSMEEDRLYLQAEGWGGLAYGLGMPLTLIVLIPMENAERGLTTGNCWWVIPLIDLLFVLQWVIWGQLLALGIRWLRSLGRGGE